MKKRVLLIDNEDVSTTLEGIEEYAPQDRELTYEVECFERFNPVAPEFNNEDGDYDFELARKALIETILNQKIDVIGCDFNLHTQEKLLTYKLIEVIREFNKSATLFIYSGGMGRSTLAEFNAEGKGPAERYLKIAMNSNIKHYIINRGAIIERVIKMLKEPSLILQVEDFLVENGSLTLNHSIEEFRGKQLFEIAPEVRKQTEVGIRFTQETIARGLSHIVALNTAE